MVFDHFLLYFANIVLDRTNNIAYGVS